MKNQLFKLISSLIIISINFLYSQIPTELNHPSNVIAKRLAAHGSLQLEYFGKNSISSVDLDKVLIDNNNEIIIRSLWDIKTPKKDTLKISNANKNKYSQFYKKLFENDLKVKKEYLFQLISDSTSIWMSFRENIVSQPNQNIKEIQFLDEFTFNGIINDNIYLSSKFSMFRHSGDRIWISDDYKNEWTKYFPDINMIFWYKNYTSLYYRSGFVDIELSNNPFSWGWSSGNSPLLSAKAIPFNRISLYKKFGNYNFEYFHGTILDKSISEIHSDNSKPEKFIAGHRVRYKLNNNLNFSISELVIYGNRSPELGYLNPISFFWAQEHNLGDLDNILFAFDFGYRAFPGLILYNTLILDELSWQDLFSDWWGNKYSYQLGIFLSSKNMKLPDLRIEYTATRPWTYTHPDFSYSHRQVPLGASYGPSSISLRAESFYLPSPKLMAHFSYESALKGIGSGSDIFDNYDNRDKKYDRKTEFLLEESYSANVLEANIYYFISNIIKFKSTFRVSQTDNLFSISGHQKEINKKFIIGLDLIW